MTQHIEEARKLALEVRNLPAFYQPDVIAAALAAAEERGRMEERERCASKTDGVGVGDGEAAIIECLAAGKPFVFDPATNFLHADDGTIEEGIRYVPSEIGGERGIREEILEYIQLAYDLSTWAACINWRGKENQKEWLDELREKIEAVQEASTILRAAVAVAPFTPSSQPRDATAKEPTP